jgi:hypothetical protein
MVAGAGIHTDLRMWRVSGACINYVINMPCQTCSQPNKTALSSLRFISPRHQLLLLPALLSSSRTLISSWDLLMATTQVCCLLHICYLSKTTCTHLGFSPDAAPTALRLGWGPLRPLDFCPEVHIGMGSFQNTLALVV